MRINNFSAAAVAAATLIFTAGSAEQDVIEVPEHKRLRPVSSEGELTPSGKLTAGRVLDGPKIYHKDD